MYQHNRKSVATRFNKNTKADFASNNSPLHCISYENHVVIKRVSYVYRIILVSFLADHMRFIWKFIGGSYDLFHIIPIWCPFYNLIWNKLYDPHMIHIYCKVANVEWRVHEIKKDNLVLRNIGLAKRLNMFLRYLNVCNLS